MHIGYITKEGKQLKRSIFFIFGWFYLENIMTSSTSTDLEDVVL